MRGFYEPRKFSDGGDLRGHRGAQEEEEEEEEQAFLFGDPSVLIIRSSTVRPSFSEAAGAHDHDP